VLTVKLFFYEELLQVIVGRGEEAKRKKNIRSPKQEKKIDMKLCCLSLSLPVSNFSNHKTQNFKLFFFSLT
jgi:hypothetical protein